MTRHIPQSFIDELLTRTDIVQIIDPHVPLKKSGSNYSALCPFHNEKTPSFSVSATKQFYYCFGCGASGNAIGFLMQYSHLSFIEAIEALATQTGLKIPQEISPHHDHINKLTPAYELMEQIALFYEQQLKISEKAMEYVKEKRNLSIQTLQQFNIGYAPPGWNNLLHAVGEQNTELLHTAGMLIKKNDADYYDRFRDRIMFPIRDKRGRIVGFGGRVLRSEDTPKYLNSPETPLFHKSQELYGLYEALKQHSTLKQLVVVEGYMDVVALAQHEIHYAVATLGTAITAQHIQRLFQICPQVIFCLDGDNAGRQAAWRALEVILPVLREEWQVSFMFLPNSEDPDSLIRKEGKNLFETRITRAHPLSAFFLRYLSHQCDMSKLEGRARFAKLAMSYVQKTPSPIIKNLLVEAIAKTASIDIKTLEKILSTEDPTEKNAYKYSGKTIGALNKTPISPLNKALQLLIQCPDLIQHCPPDFIALKENLDLSATSHANFLLMNKLIQVLRNSPHLTTGALLERWREAPEEASILAQFASQPLITPEKGLSTEFQDIMNHLFQQRRQNNIDVLLGKMRQQVITIEEKAKLQQLLKEKNDI